MITTPPPTASAQAFYSSAIAAMDRLNQPPFVRYALHGQSDNIHVTLLDAGHNIWLSFQGGSAPTDWRVTHRTQDYASEVLPAYGVRYVSARPFFDPTWFGAFRALRDGMIGYQNAAAPRDALSIAQATASPDAELHTIASVSVIGPGIYSVEDRGATTCPNGDPGRALHLVPRRRDPRRQLSDVIVDPRSMRFCMIRFGWSESGFFTGFMEQHYADIDGYWVVTDGLLDGTLRIFGIKTHHFIWNYQLSDMTFPQSLPDVTFVPDASQ